MNEQSPSQLTGVEAAIRALDVKGTRAELARRLKVSRVAVYSWKNIIPLKRLADAERITGLPREILRPDFISAIAKTGVPLEALRPSLAKRIVTKKPKRRATA